MDIYIEEIPEHYTGPAISVTIHSKPSGMGEAEKISRLLDGIPDYVFESFLSKRSQLPSASADGS